jgi:hypothetical protein
MEMETDNGQLKVTERFFVHNTSSPPLTQWSAKSFAVVLPPYAVVDGVGGQRPNGLPTTIKMDPDGPKGHYAFNFPIQPDDGEKDTLFQIAYHLPYDGKSSFKVQETLPADNVAVLLPKSMTFSPGSGANFKSVPEDPNVQTFVAKNAAPGQTIEFAISGTGSIPRENQGTPGAQQPAGMGGQDASADTSGAAPGGQPGGGIGKPIDTPDPLSKYKWWILGGLAILLAAGAAFMLRKPAGAPVTPVAPPVDPAPPAYPVPTPAGKNSALLGVLKDEMFTLESERISGTIDPADYAEIKSALETVLKRALSKK